MKDKLLKLIADKQNKIDDLAKRSAASEDVKELRSMNAEMESLQSEMDELRSTIEEIEASETRAAQKKQIIGTYGAKQVVTEPTARAEGEVSDVEKRAAEFKASGSAVINPLEMRAVTVGSGDLAKPTVVKGTITDAFNEVSSIVDLVTVTDAQGMGEYQVPYVVGYGEGAIKGENADYGEDDPEFAYAAIKPIKITIYTEVSKEVTKLTNVQYLDRVRQAALIALRKKVAKLIPLGNPSATPVELTGIVNADAITADALEFSAIDEKTLRKIAMNYGGDENIVGNAALFLNKADLIAFGDVRGDDKKAVYEITPDAANPNAGIIKDGGLSVRYVINSAFSALSAAGTAGDTVCMAYGVPSAYELALFSPYSIEVSTEAAFKKGMLAVRGEVMVGGNVVHANGFVLVAKAGE